MCWRHKWYIINKYTDDVIRSMAKDAIVFALGDPIDRSASIVQMIIEPFPDILSEIKTP